MMLQPSTESTKTLLMGGSGCELGVVEPKARVRLLGHLLEVYQAVAHGPLIS